MKKEIVMCSVCGVIALVLGVLCHRLTPGLGLVLMPMFWPLAFLSTRVSVSKSVATAAIVPFVSFLITGMPVMPLIVAVKFVVFTVVAGYLWRKLGVLRRR